MDKTRYGVIGLGWFGEKHLEALAGNPGVEIHALCTRTPERLAQVAERFQVRNTFTDYRQMLADPGLESVSITTMWDQHRDPTLAALEAGKHVFLEKPMASTVEDCQAIVDAAAASPGKFMVGHICRFNPRYAAAKQAVDEGRLGRIVALYARRNLPARVGSQVLDKIGPIIGDGVHDTDLMLWFTSARIVSAYGQTVAVHGHRYPDAGHAMYRFDNGATGVIEDVWCLPEKTPFQIDERMEVIGTEGSIQVHDTHPNLTIVDGEGVRCPDTTYWPNIHGACTGALREELNYFVRSIVDDTPIDVITPQESLEAVRACLAAEESARTGQVVHLD